MGPVESKSENSDQGTKLEFANSTYKRYLIMIPKQDVDGKEFHNVIMDSLAGEFRTEYANVLAEHPDEPPKLIATRVWTGDKFYGYMKGVLLKDDEEGCRALAPFMRALNRNLVCQQVKEMVTYRGTKMSPEDVKWMHELFVATKARGIPLVTRVPTYYASSKSLAKAEEFTTEHGYKLKLNIPAGCPNANYIAPWSKYPGEEEVLFPPWTAMRVDKVDPASEFTVELTVLDNWIEPETINLAQTQGVSSTSVTKVCVGYITGCAAPPSAANAGLPEQAPLLYTVAAQAIYDGIQAADWLWNAVSMQNEAAIEEVSQKTGASAQAAFGIDEGKFG